MSKIDKRPTWFEEFRETTDIDGRKVVLLGRTIGKKCRDCDFFYSDVRAKTYHRCARYPNKNWRALQEACRYFKEITDVND